MDMPASQASKNRQCGLAAAKARARFHSTTAEVFAATESWIGINIPRWEIFYEVQWGTLIAKWER